MWTIGATFVCRLGVTPTIVPRKADVLLRLIRSRNHDDLSLDLPGW